MISIFLTLALLIPTALFSFENTCGNAYEKDRVAASEIIQFLKDGGNGFVIKAQYSEKNFGTFYALKKVDGGFQYLSTTPNDSARFFNNSCLLETIESYLPKEKTEDITTTIFSDVKFTACVNARGFYNQACSQIYSKIWGREANRKLAELK